MTLYSILVIVSYEVEHENESNYCGLTTIYKNNEIIVKIHTKTDVDGMVVIGLWDHF